MNPAPEVSARAFLGLVRFVKDEHGDAALADVIAAGGELLAPVFARKIRITDWFPYPAYVAFLHALDRRIGGKDPAFFRNLGALAGKRDLGTIFRVYVALSSPERLIRSCSKIWPSYYRNAGEMRALEWEPTGTRLRISGFTAMDPAHCRLMEGWMIQTMETIGFKVNSDAREAECASRGGAHHEFVCTWNRFSRTWKNSET